MRSNMVSASRLLVSATRKLVKSTELPNRKFARAGTRDGNRKRAGSEGAWPGGNKVAAKIGRIAGIGPEVRRVAGRHDHFIAGSAPGLRPGQQSRRYRQ